MDSLDIKVLKEKVNNINFLRAWVVRVKILSPILFSVTWLNGEETEIELKK
jgi:site-specific DNA recombinase